MPDHQHKITPKACPMNRHAAKLACLALCLLPQHSSLLRGQTIAGDGKTDDTAAIQALVDASTGDLKLTRGTYKITQPIIVDLQKVARTSIRGGGVARFVMEGPGPAFRFIGTHNGTASPDTVKPEVWQRQNGPMIDGIEIIGRHEAACGIEATGTMQLTLTRVIIRDALHGVHLTGRNRNVTLSQCHIYDNDGVGVFLDRLNLHQINIANCHISYNDAGGVVSKKSEIRNLQIGTCDIEGNMGDNESPPTANVYLDSTDSSLGEVAIVGCTIQHSHDAPRSANIFINGKSVTRPFTEELRTGNITIANNVLSDVQYNLSIHNVRGIAITGNTMWKGYSRNVWITDSKNIVMSGNILDRNPRYHYGDGRDAKLGVLLKECADATITGNQSFGVVEHPAAWEIRKCTRLNFCANSIFDYGDRGLLLSRVENSRVSDCLIRDDRTDAQGTSVELSSCRRVDLTDNQLSHPAKQ
ncbi:MAG: right-handed parallel beta-helix repeat-containing protein [Aureliella sp.]